MNSNQWQPQLEHKTFQNQGKVNVFKKVQDHELNIKLDHPQTTTKHIMQVQEIVELNRLIEPHF